MQLDKAIKERRSVRNFTSKRPDWREIIECVDAMRHIPRAGNNFHLKFILIDNENTINQLADAAQQDFIKKSQFVLAVCINKKLAVSEFGKKGETYCQQELGAAIEHFLLKLVEKGLSGCWVGHFEENQIKRALKIPLEIEVGAIIPIGYEKGIPKSKRKTDLDRLLYFNTYKNEKMNRINKVD